VATTVPREVSTALLFCTGSEFVPSHEQLVNAEGSALRFSPDFDEQHRGPDGTAYVIYRFNLQGVDDTHTLSISWVTPPEDTADLWLGLSRWAKGCWEWHSAPAGDTLELTYWAKTLYGEPASGDLYVVVLLTGTAEAVLQQLQLNGSSTPSAHLTADPTSGAPPLMVSFDASGSSSPAGNIVKYEWDWDGDGNYDTDSGATPTTSHEYPAGSYTTGLRVTDEIGSTATTSVSISAALPVVWPMYGHDAQNTHRSPYVGAQTNNVKWTFTTEDRVYSSPAIGADGTVYITSRDGKLYAINPNGSQKWSCTLGEGSFHDPSSPAIGLDGTLYVINYDGNLYAINPDGSQKWTYEIGGGVNATAPQSPTIGIDGKVYVKGDNEVPQSVVYAINPDGSLSWTWTNSENYGAYQYPAIGHDGTVYQTFLNCIRAFNSDGSLQWEYYPEEGTAPWSPSVGVDGTIYICPTNTLIALNPDGSKEWSYTTEGSPGTSPAIWADGTVCVKADELHAINPDGSLKWSVETTRHNHSTPAVSADGTLYLGIGWDVQAINPDGSPKWSYTTGWTVHSSPAIGEDGTVYVGSLDGKLYAFGE
jgi:outer membrane protein assembly factor BamB